jgi:hypothetical protein
MGKARVALVVAACLAFVGLAALPAAAGGRTASLSVQISMLPDHVPGDVTVTGPDHFHAHLVDTETLDHLAPGTYTVRAGPARHGPNRFFPAPPVATASLTAGQQGAVDVDYADVVPDTTAIAAPSTVAGLSGSPGSGAATLALTSLPARLTTGDIIAVGVTAATPDGFLGQVTSISQNGAAFSVATVPATLYQALPRGVIDPSWTEPSQSADVAESNLSCGASASLSLTGSVSLTPSYEFSVQWDNNTVTAASVHGSETLTQQLQEAVQGQASCTLDHQPLLAEPVVFDPIEVQVGPVPVVLVPELQFYLDADASTSASLTIGGTFQATATAGLDYANGQLTPTSQFTTAFTPQPPTPDLQADVSASVGPTLAVLLYGLGGPQVNFDGSLAMHVAPLASPAWTLTGGLNAGAGLTIPILSFDKSNPSIISYPKLLASSPPVITAASLPSGTVGTSYDQALQAGQGTPPYTWSVASGTMPPGLSLDASTGAITGTPTLPGSYTFTVQVLDGSTAQLSPSGQSATAQESIAVRSATASWSVAPAGTVRAFAIDAASSSDVWAVSGGSIEHWDGSAWTTADTVPGARFNAIHAISANDVWAAGYQTIGGTLLQTLTLHWNGISWSTIPSPDVGDRDNQLTSVAGTLTNDLWAVGYYNDPANGFEEPLAEHWDGQTWTVATLPNDGNGNNTQLLSVSMDTQGDAWAVGYTIGSAANSQATPVTERWSGGTWQVIPSPVFDPSHPWELTGVAAVAPDNVWAVGTVFNNPPAPPVPDLIEHWDGTSWTVESTPDPAGAQFSSLSGISALSASDIWAVGTWTDSNALSHTLIKHWDGANWSVAASPDPGAYANSLLAVVATAANDAWAVGGYSDNVNSATQPLYLHYG